MTPPARSAAPTCDHSPFTCFRSRTYRTSVRPKALWLPRCQWGRSGARFRSAISAPRRAHAAGYPFRPRKPWNSGSLLELTLEMGCVGTSTSSSTSRRSQSVHSTLAASKDPDLSSVDLEFVVSKHSTEPLCCDPVGESEHSLSVWNWQSSGHWRSEISRSSTATNRNDRAWHGAVMMCRDVGLPAIGRE
jgi:hypothetical protein